MHVSDGDDVTSGAGAENAPRAFISHASADAAMAQRLVAALEGNGIRCWIAPRDVPPGAQYADAIVRAISEASVFLVLLSANSVASAHVAREVEWAGSKGRRFLALRLDAAPLTPALEYFLGESQWVDLQAGEEAAAARLVQAIRQAPGPATALGIPAQTPGSQQASKRAPIALLACAALAIVGILVWKFLPPKAAPAAAPARSAVAATPEKSIAVLPFTDMSEKKDQEYFSDGLSEELIDLLTKIRELRVPARASSFYFKGQHTTIPEIAKALGVTYVLEGSVRRSGDTMRVRTELIRADNGFNVWSESYDRKIADVFKMQDEIASAVVKALSVALSDGGIRADHGVVNSEAYDLYLQGHKAMEQGDSEASTKILVGLFERSVASDPTLARAWAGLARSYVMQYENYPATTPVDVLGKARSAAKKAIQLAPNDAEAHTAMQRLYTLDWDWKLAEQEARRAIELEPSNTTVLRNAAYLYEYLGRPQQAVTYLKTAVELDPLNGYNIARLGRAYRVAGDSAHAVAAYKKALQLSPSAEEYRAELAIALVMEGQPEAALATLELEPGSLEKASTLPIVLHRLGRSQDAEVALEHFAATYGSQYPTDVGSSFAVVGHLDQAFSWWERAFNAHDPELIAIKTVASGEGHPEIARDPRFKALLQKMNLPME